MENAKRTTSGRRLEPMSKERLYFLDLPIVFREPFIYSGYRPLGRKWLYYLSSLFQIHTETANVWSHLLGMLYFIYKTYQISDKVDFLGDPLAWAFLAFTCASVGYTFLSAAAHLLHSKSPEAHFLCYQIDYIGICLNCQSIGLCTYFLIGHDLFYRTFGWGFLVVNALCAVAVCAGCSISKLGYRRPYPFVSKLWRLIPATLCSVVCGCMPLFYKTYGWLVGEGGGDLLLLCYAIMGWTAIGAFFFVTYIPERFAPGRFDLIGHSHFIFHVILVYITHLQYEAFLISYLRTTAKHRQVMVNPSPISTVGMQVLAILGCLLVLYLTRGMRKARAEGSDACCVGCEQNGNEFEVKPKTQ